VRFVGLGSSALEVEVFAYLRVPDFDRSLAVREELLLQIMEVVADAGTGFAFPSQTAYMANDVAISPERARAAEARVAAWRASGQSPIEGVAADRIVSLGTEPKPQR
jgi:MscS family membrane protein